MDILEREISESDLLTGQHKEAIELLLFREARLLDAGKAREWLERLVDKEVRYQVQVRELRSTRHKGDTPAGIVNVYDDDYAALEARVRQSETEMLWRAEPPESYRRFVTNIECYRGAASGTVRVLAKCMVVRNRRIYEEATFVYGRDDIFRADGDGHLRLYRRRVDYAQRYVGGKNLLFFL